MTIGPQHSEVIVLSYEPILYTAETHPEICDSDPCEVTDGAILTILSNDEAKSPLDIEIRGGDNRCPVAVARARIAYSSTWSTHIDAFQEDQLELDGSQSLALGEVVSYHWEVTRQPEDSTSDLSTYRDMAHFLLDELGEYQFELSIVDDRGILSCQPAVVTASVRNDSAVLVEMTWNTDNSDIDLHFLNPNGSWLDRPWDCSCTNHNPDWGDPGFTRDDPLLDFDDVDGFGPECVILARPEGVEADPRTYSVGAYGRHSNGQTDVSMKIYIWGELAFESTLIGLGHGEFWDSVRITWPGGLVEDVNRLYPSGFP
jgi:hypothetical protein